MVEFYIDPEDVIADFLRVYLTDPRDRAENIDTNNFSSSSGQTEFTITPPSGSISCITSLTINGVDKTKWVDYFWDYQLSQVTFYNGLVLNDSVVVNFKYGSSNWIYSDKPNKKITAESFPRISLFTFGGTGRKLGNYKAPVHSSPVLQIDTWSRVNQVFTINGRQYSNEYLGRYLGNQILKAFEEHEEELFGIFFDYDILGIPKAAPYSEEYNSYHSVTEIMVHGLNIGKIIK